VKQNINSFHAKNEISRLEKLGLRDSFRITVSEVTCYGLDNRCSISGGMKFFFSPPPPDRLWVPYSLLSNGHRGLFPWR